MTIKFSFDVSFYNLQNWKGIWEKAGKFHSAKAYVTSNETVILPVVLHGHSKGEHGVLDIRVLRRIFKRQSSEVRLEKICPRGVMCSK
jgi:hypothetical protein